MDSALCCPRGKTAPGTPCGRVPGRLRRSGRAAKRARTRAVPASAARAPTHTIERGDGAPAHALWAECGGGERMVSCRKAKQPKARLCITSAAGQSPDRYLHTSAEKVSTGRTAARQQLLSSISFLQLLDQLRDLLREPVHRILETRQQIKRHHDRKTHGRNRRHYRLFYIPRPLSTIK